MTTSNVVADGSADGLADDPAPGRDVTAVLDQSEPALRVAVLIPCHNEQAAIAGVVTAFRAALPDATIYVYDNNSTDRTAVLAAAAGAQVRHESMQGKGYVV
jgi:hypothetical protein